MLLGVGVWLGSDPPAVLTQCPAELVGRAPLCKAASKLAGSSPRCRCVDRIPNTLTALHPWEVVREERVMPAYTPGSGEQDRGTGVHHTILIPSPCGCGWERPILHPCMGQDETSPRRTVTLRPFAACLTLCFSVFSRCGLRVLELVGLLGTADSMSFSRAS